MAFWDELGIMNQPMIYWGPPVEDDRGNETYAPPKEIYGYYTGKNEFFIRKMEGTGKQEGANTKITTPTKIENDGYIILDSLSNYQGEDLSNPKVFGAEACRVMVVHKSPDIDSGEILYRGYLK